MSGRSRSPCSTGELITCLAGRGRGESGDPEALQAVGKPSGRLASRASSLCGGTSSSWRQEVQDRRQAIQTHCRRPRVRVEQTAGCRRPVFMSLGFSAAHAVCPDHLPSALCLCLLLWLPLCEDEPPAAGGSALVH